jgi:hypothetical protein
MNQNSQNPPDSRSKMNPQPKPAPLDIGYSLLAVGYSSSRISSLKKSSQKAWLFLPLGHASLETTAIYTEMNVESRRHVFSACHPAEKRWQEKQC